jgi:hypothetical protein
MAGPGKSFGPESLQTRLFAGANLGAGQHQQAGLHVAAAAQVKPTRMICG